MKRDILLLGNPALYEKSSPVQQEELISLESVVRDLHDTLAAYRKTYGVGRAIAAPQIGVKKRLIYQYIDKPMIYINPKLELCGSEQMTVHDDCMSFPNLRVLVLRHKRCRVKYFDMNWQQQESAFKGDLSELFQHEYDHLDGVLATMRAIDNKSFFMEKNSSDS